MAEVNSPLGMSDEEFLKQDLSQLEEALIEQQASQEETTPIDTSEEEQTSEEVTSEDSEETGDKVDPYDETEESESNDEESEEEILEDEVADLEGDTQPEAETLEDAKETESEDTDVTEDTEPAENKEDTLDTAKVDFEEAYKRIMAPFKASKRMMQVDNIDDAISLMQKGADYHSKMKTLSPHLKMVNMLEKEGLLNQDKLNNLIDLSKNNPQAIAKLIKDSGIDPLDIDTSEENNYKPSNYAISDNEFKLNQVLEDIKSSPSYDKTLRIVGREWDSESKKAVSENPDIISVINEHVSSGIYETVQGIVDKERALGRLNVPDVDAYKQVAENLMQQGNLVPENTKSNIPSKASVPKTKAQDPAVIQQKRKAAAGTRKTSGKSGSAPSEYLGMTDEEFMKLADV